MEGIGEHIYTICSFLILAITLIFRHQAKLRAIYNHAKTAFFYVEEIAISEGLVKEEKVALFKVKFKEFMKTGLYYVNERTLTFALDIAKAFCSKYRPETETQNKKFEASSKIKEIGAKELGRVIEASTDSELPTVMLVPLDESDRA